MRIKNINSKISEDGEKFLQNLEIVIKQEIEDREIPQSYLIKVLNLLPVGIEVLYAQEWDLNTSFWMADSLELPFDQLVSKALERSPK